MLATVKATNPDSNYHLTQMMLISLLLESDSRTAGHWTSLRSLSLGLEMNLICKHLKGDAGLLGGFTPSLAERH